MKPADALKIFSSNEERFANIGGKKTSSSNMTFL